MLTSVQQIVIVMRDVRPYKSVFVWAPTSRYSTRGVGPGGITNRGFSRLPVHFDRREKNCSYKHGCYSLDLWGAEATRSPVKHALNVVEENFLYTTENYILFLIRYFKTSLLSCPIGFFSIPSIDSIMYHLYWNCNFTLLLYRPSFY
jgi:hypothetical protein